MLDDHLHVNGHGDLGALRATHQGRLQAGELNVQVLGDGGQHVAVNALSGNLEGDRGLRLGLDLDGLAGLDAEGGAVHDLAVDEDVTVDDHLTGLLDGAGEAGTQDQGVQAHLEQLDQVLTGQAGGAAGLFEGATQLRLTDAVLGAQTLLFLQTNGVVGVLATAGAAVLAGAVGALLEVADGLGGQRE